MNVIVNHVGHCVADLEKARRFYIEALGFAPWRELHVPDTPSDRLLRLSPPIGLTACYLRLGEFVLELLHYADAELAPPVDRPFNQQGLTHLSMCVHDVNDTCRRVTELGGSVLEDTNIGAAVMVRDPDGQILELLPLGYRERLGDA